MTPVYRRDKNKHLTRNTLLASNDTSKLNKRFVRI